VAYKADIDDVRESPSLDLIEILEREGARVSYCDPYVPTLRHAGKTMRSVPFRPGSLRAADCVVIATAHKKFDYGVVSRHARTVVDCRNARKGRRTRGVTRL
jgi:UDP-N-acetyl-D-glucosamine dehydrogenase